MNIARSFTAGGGGEVPGVPLEHPRWDELCWAQPFAVKRGGRLPCEGNKGTRVLRARLASRECWQRGCRCSGKKAPERGERLSSGGCGSPAGKGDQEVCAAECPLEPGQARAGP